MTVARLRREMSELEYRTWMAVYRIEAERAAHQAFFSRVRRH
jgi:hypothetical protein